jgi:hypothetical protein
MINAVHFFFVKNATEKGNILEKAKIPQEALA